MAKSSNRPVAEALASLPAYYGMRDLVEALGSHDAVMDAYVLGLLPAKAIDAIELTDPARLQCWLLARILRLALAQAAPRPRTP